MDYAFVGENVLKVRERIARAALRAGRKPEDVTLLAVTKFHPAEAVLAAYRSGIRSFGENRVQEAMQKYGPELRASLNGAQLAMIGTLQSNKAKKAALFFDSVQSVDSSELLVLLARKSIERSTPLRILLELHTGEASKSGFPDMDSLCKAIDGFLEGQSRGEIEHRMEICGLMTMAPNVADSRVVRESFRTLAKAREAIVSKYHFESFTELSMGMSGDFEIAIEEGSTCVRIGTALFGARQ